MSALQCWRCGAPLDDEPLPLARAATCRGCRADLHVCRLCQFHAPQVANECREPIAERVVNKERANFCGYFTPRDGAFRAETAADGARAALDSLFGVAGAPASPRTASEAQAALDDLFKKT